MADSWSEVTADRDERQQCVFENLFGAVNEDSSLGNPKLLHCLSSVEPVQAQNLFPRLPSCSVLSCFVLSDDDVAVFDSFSRETTSKNFDEFRSAVVDCQNVPQGVKK
jgi:hypothetical protein